MTSATAHTGAAPARSTTWQNNVRTRIDGLCKHVDEHLFQGRVIQHYTEFQENQKGKADLDKTVTKIKTITTVALTTLAYLVAALVLVPAAGLLTMVTGPLAWTMLPAAAAGLYLGARNIVQWADKKTLCFKYAATIATTTMQDAARRREDLRAAGDVDRQGSPRPPRDGDDDRGDFSTRFTRPLSPRWDDVSHVPSRRPDHLEATMFSHGSRTSHLPPRGVVGGHEPSISDWRSIDVPTTIDRDRRPDHFSPLVEGDNKSRLPSSSGRASPTGVPSYSFRPEAVRPSSRERMG